MDWKSQCAVVIPCFNEGKTIASIVAAVRMTIPNVIVVDDGSSDKTSENAKAAGAEIIRFSQSKGKGAALISGWNLAKERGYEFALAMDGDGQHSPDDILKFLRCAETTGADLIVGNRMPDALQMPILRRFVNRWMSKKISMLAGMHFPDSQCGFRLMKLDEWSALKTDAAHFEIESEILLAFAHAKKKIEFVPIRVIYRNERSKISPVRDTLRWFRWLSRVK
jgi:glycosyltransferase involved in cell wall biosynthesis